MTKIAVIVGSLHEKSLNKMLAKNLEALLPEGVEFDYLDINLPLFNQDLEQNEPAEVMAAKQKVEAADGVLLLTPEYNRSFTGVIKNATDWISRPWGHNSFAKKPTGIVGATGSPTGTMGAQKDLRGVMVYLDTILMGQPELCFASAHTMFDESGVVVEAAREHLQKYIDAFIVHVESHKK